MPTETLDPKAAPNGADPIDPSADDVKIPPAAPSITVDDIAKIVDAKLQIILERMTPAAPVESALPAGKDPMDQIAEELAAEEKIDPKVAKAFVNKFARLNDHLNKGMKDQLQAFQLQGKFAQIFSSEPDAEKLAPKMAETFKRLQPFEQIFVLNSPEGARWIFDKTKRDAGMYIQPDTRIAASLPPGRSPTPDRKLGGKQELFAKATDCLTKGDRTGYENYMAQIMRG